MKTNFFVQQPSHWLASSVEAFWYAEGPPDQTRERVFPNGVVEWIFNIGASPHKVLAHDNPGKFEIFRESWVAGFQNSYLTIQSMGETKLFGIQFKPGGAYPFLKMPLDEVTNQVIDIDLVLGKSLDGIVDRLYSAPSAVKGFVILENLLLQILDKSRFDPLIPYVIRFLSSRPINTLAEETGISHKQLIQRFHRQVGTSPKKVQQIMNFQKAIQLMANRANINLTLLAHDLGYYDQAHFNHLFKQLSGVSPTFYLDQRLFDPNHLILAG